MGQRKAELARRRIDRGELVSDRSLHADGLEGHDRRRLRGRAPRCWWSSLQHSGVRLLPAGQLYWTSTVLEEPLSCHDKYPTITRCQGYGRSCSKQWCSEER